MSDVYVVRLTARQRELALMHALADTKTATSAQELREHIELADVFSAARPEHPERQSAMEQLADVCHAVQGKITWDDAHSQEAFMVALEVLAKINEPYDVPITTLYQWGNEWSVELGCYDIETVSATGPHFGPAVCRLAEKVLNAEKT